MTPGLVHYLLHKPRGVLTTADDPQGRPTVIELVPADPRVFPVGRLDADSEGLLLLTNDGDLAQRLAHPSYGVEKEYVVETAGVPTPGALRRLRQGVTLDDGPTAPARVGVVAPGVLRIVVHEGRNRQVRRMCEAVGFPVRRLVRTRIGPLSDHRLAPGQWRVLAPDEVRALAAGAAPRPPWPAAPVPPDGPSGLDSMPTMPPEAARRRAAVVGTGLIGGSIGLALRARGWHVTGSDADHASAERALALGALDAVGEDTEAEITFVATPVGAVEAEARRSSTGWRVPTPWSPTWRA